MTDPRDEWLRTGGGMRALPDTQAEQIRQLTGRVLAGYRVAGLIGSGGMGLVLRAERAEGDFERTVAIKLVPGTSPATDIAQRFQTERQILAGLNHPCIAQLYDGGQTEEGWPYLVMEYVDGLPVDEFCRQQALSTDERVKLLARITDAVAFAHARLVVHRDIKPSNVMVTHDGNPKLLDFGIAKLLDPAASRETRGERLLTPQYASPEQLLGSPITTGSDIYQLGALYLSVLADEPPFRETSLEEAVSRAASGREVQVSEKARREIPADLVAIIEKCLRSSPRDRYTGAGAVQTDLQNYLEGFPVSAKRGAALYRARKLVGRNKLASAFAAAAVAIAIGGSAVYAVDMRQATSLAEERARTAENLLQAMSTMITETYSELIETGGQRRGSGDAASELRNEPLRLVLERTSRLIGESMTEEPRLRAELLRVQGMTNRELNRIELARAQLAEALDLAAGLGNPDLEVGILSELVRLVDTDADFDSAEAYVQRGLEVLDAEPVSAENSASLHTAAALMEKNRASFERAADHALQSIRLLESLPGEPGLPLARAYVQMAEIYGGLERAEDLEAYMEKAAELFEGIEGPLYRGLFTVYSGLAWSNTMSGEYGPAKESMLRAIDVARANFGERHPRTATGYNNLGLIYRRTGELDQALDYLMRALDIARETAPNGRQLPNLYLNIGNTFQDLGEMQKAAAYFEEGLSLPELPETERRQYGFFLNNYGSLLTDLGETRRGEELLREAVAVKSEVLGELNVSTARSALLLAQSQIRTGKDVDVSELIRRARAAFEESYGVGHRKMSFLLLVEGQYLRMQGDLAGANQKLEEALQARREEYEDDHAQTTVVFCELARTAVMAAETEAAQQWLDLARPGMAQMLPSRAEHVEAAVVAAEVASLIGGATAPAAKEQALALVQRYFPARRDLRDRLAAI